MPSIEGASIDCPTRWTITVVNLLERDARRHDNVFHLGSVVYSNVGIGVERLDKNATTPVCQSGKNERPRLFTAKQSRLYSHTSGQQ